VTVEIVWTVVAAGMLVPATTWIVRWLARAIVASIDGGLDERLADRMQDRWRADLDDTIGPIRTHLDGISTRIDPMSDTVAALAAEVRPNGGDSLRDQVDHLTVRLGNVEGQLEELCSRYSGRWDQRPLEGQ